MSAFPLYCLIFTDLSMLWSAHLARYQLFDLTALGTGAGALVLLMGSFQHANLRTPRWLAMLCCRDLSTPQP